MLVLALGLRLISYTDIFLTLEAWLLSKSLILSRYQSVTTNLRIFLELAQFLRLTQSFTDGAYQLVSVATLLS